MARDNGHKDSQTDALMEAILRVPSRRYRRAICITHYIHGIVALALVVAVVLLVLETGRLRRTVQSLRDTLTQIIAGHADKQAVQDE